MHAEHVKTLTAALARLELLDALDHARGLAPNERTERDTLLVLSPALRAARDVLDGTSAATCCGRRRVWSRH